MGRLAMGLLSEKGGAMGSKWYSCLELNPLHGASSAWLSPSGMARGNAPAPQARHPPCDRRSIATLLRARPGAELKRRRGRAAVSRLACVGKGRTDRRVRRASQLRACAYAMRTVRCLKRQGAWSPRGSNWTSERFAPDRPGTAWRRLPAPPMAVRRADWP